ncbi:MAG TPA: hypothetical protein VFU14_15330 [Acidimicrobiales bacterium]|nr:hypothetical protein [Acidimicrobiales bacterium]
MTAVERAPAAEGQLDEPARAGDGFAAYAVTTRSGPHVTMQAGVVHGGRFITTTSRSSLKARSVRAHRTAAAAIEHDDGTTEVVSGATVSVDLRHPEGMLTDPAGALIAGPAALRLAGDQLEQLLGYVEAAGRVPSGWLPHNRVLLVTRIDRSLLLQGFDVLDGSGDWAPELPGPAEPLEHAPTQAQPLPELPEDVAGLVQSDAPARIGLTAEHGPVVLPARWRCDDRFDVSASALAQLGARLPGAGCATFDDSSSRRPDRKRGVMLRGALALVDVDGPRATLAVQADRITAWDGFSAQTTDVGER